VQHDLHHPVFGGVVPVAVAGGAIMKTTIAISTNRRVVVQPCAMTPGGVILKVVDQCLEIVYQSLTVEQIGALMFALETASEASTINAERVAECETEAA
jgi:hypothetical protein